MKINGNILSRIEREMSELGMEISNQKKLLKEAKFIRNTLISSLNKSASALNKEWKDFLKQKKDSISDGNFLGRYIKSFSLSPLTKEEFLFSFGFLYDLTISFMYFSKHKNNSKEKPYIAICCPCNENNRLIQAWDMNHPSKNNFFGNEFLVFHRASGDDRYAVMCMSGTKEDDILIKLSQVKVQDKSQDDWHAFSVVAKRIIEKFSSQSQRLSALEGVLREMSEAEMKISALEQKILKLTSQSDELNSIAIDSDKLNEILNLTELFVSGSKVQPKGILLYGPPGTGKTLIARLIAKHIKCHFEAVNVSDLKGPHIGHSAKRVKDIWQKCRNNSPSILFIDECEGVFPVRGSIDSDSFSNELVQTFISEWDGFHNENNQVLVIGATNRHDILDSAVLSRFTSSVEIPLPNESSRRKIFFNELKTAGIDITIDDKIIVESAGMAGRDIKTLIANISATGSHNSITPQDIITRIRKLRGKSSSSTEHLSWDDIVLSDDLLSEFRTLGEELRNSEKLEMMGIPAPKSALLYGPPGTGKTQLARVLSSQSGLSFLSATTADLKASYIGQSGNKVKELFDKARMQSPCIIFLDEIDILAKGRNQASDSFNNEIIGQLLQELDGISSKKGIFLLAASNIPESIDSALLSRLERKIEIGLPDFESRVRILFNLLHKKPINFDANEVNHIIAGKTEGYSGRDLESIVVRATRLSVNRCFLLKQSVEDIVITEADLIQSMTS